MRVGARMMYTGLSSSDPCSSPHHQHTFGPERKVTQDCFKLGSSSSSSSFTFFFSVYIRWMQSFDLVAKLETLWRLRLQSLLTGQYPNMLLSLSKSCMSHVGKKSVFSSNIGCELKLGGTVWGSGGDINEPLVKCWHQRHGTEPGQPLCPLTSFSTQTSQRGLQFSPSPHSVQHNALVVFFFPHQKHRHRVLVLRRRTRMRMLLH